MLPLKLTLRGIGPYVDQTVDFQSIPGDVVAIIGANGSGKTFLLDGIFAALYRFFPYRSDFYRYCQPKSQIIFDFQIGGRIYRSILNINSKKREMEPWLQILDGLEYKPITDGKSGTFDKEIAKLCGPAELVLSSVYAAQEKKGSFITLPKAGRKELFVDMLGLGRLQVISDRAGEKEKYCKDAYEKLSAKAEVLKATASKQDIDLDAFYAKIGTARDEVGIAEADIKLNTFEVGILRAKVQSAKEVEFRQFPVHKRKQAITRDLSEIKKSISDSELLVERLPALRDMALRHDTVAKEIDGLRVERCSLLTQRSEHHKQQASYIQAIRGLEQEKNLQQSLVAQQNAALKRARKDSAIIDTVPCHAEGDCAECQFLVNAVQCRNEISEMEAKVDEATASSLAIESQMRALPSPDSGNLSQIESQLSNMDSRIKLLESEWTNISNAKNQLVAAEAAENNLADLRVRRERLQGDLLQVEFEMAELETALKAAKEAEADLRKAEKKLEMDQEALDGSRQHLNSLLAEVTRAETELAVSRSAQAELDKLMPDLAKLDRDRRSWNLLSRAFGKTGIQSLEIDSAGPLVSEIANDLLFSCFGPRFSLKFVTQVLKDDRSGFKDEFDIYVSDAEASREGSIDDLSGGEKVVVLEGLSLAIALFNRTRSDVGWESLFRDESSSAVDDQRAPRYIQMLRRAREAGHFKKSYFITHQGRVREGADSKIIVTNGHIGFE